jgi:flagellar motor switch protein FliN/FliY
MRPDPQTILQLRVPLIVRIGRRRMACEEVLALGPGAIIELDKAAADPLSVMANNKAIGDGVAVKLGENFGLRVSRVLSSEDRLQAALGGEEDGQ